MSNDGFTHLQLFLVFRVLIYHWLECNLRKDISKLVVFDF